LSGDDDEMAIGAIRSMRQAGVDMSQVAVAGIDATTDGPWKSSRSHPRWPKACRSPASAGRFSIRRSRGIGVLCGLRP
jgi:hypothetical protein